MFYRCTSRQWECFCSSCLFPLSHLLPFWFPSPYSLLPPALWNDLVIPLGSKCDISTRSCSYSSVPIPLPYFFGTQSLFKGQFTLGPVTNHIVQNSNHNGGEASLVNCCTAVESKREREKDRWWEAFSAIFGPRQWPREQLHSPLPLFSLSLWSLDLLNRWNGYSEEGLALWTQSGGLVWTTVCFGLCHSCKHSQTVSEF